MSVLSQYDFALIPVKKFHSTCWKDKSMNKSKCPKHRSTIWDFDSQVNCNVTKIVSQLWNSGMSYLISPCYSSCSKRNWRRCLHNISGGGEGQTRHIMGMCFFKITPSLNETFHKLTSFNIINTMTQLQEIFSYLFRGLRMFSPARLTTASHWGKGDLEISL